MRRPQIGRPVIFAIILSWSSSASALSLFEPSSEPDKASRVRLDLGGEIYVQSKGRRPDGGEMNFDFAVKRARLNMAFYFAKTLKLKFEPDFGGAEVDLADVYLEVRPSEIFDIRVGQAKTPYGVFETMGRWKLPSMRRGMIHDLITDRHGFGGRRLGARLRARFKSWAFSPTFELGSYTDDVAERGPDGAARMSFKLSKKLSLQAAGYARAAALSDEGYGRIGALSAVYNKKEIWLAGEVLLGRSKLLRSDGFESGQDATFWGARALLSFQKKFEEDFLFGPYLGGEFLDTDIRTRADTGVAYRVGLNFLWKKMYRMAVEFDRQTGEEAFPNPARSTLTVLVGGRLE